MSSQVLRRHADRFGRHFPSAASLKSRQPRTYALARAMRSFKAQDWFLPRLGSLQPLDTSIPFDVRHRAVRTAASFGTSQPAKWAALGSGLRVAHYILIQSGSPT